MINGASPVAGKIRTSKYLRASGWNAPSVEEGAGKTKNVILLKSADRPTLIVPLVMKKRPDVVAHLGAAQMEDAGYEVLADASLLKGRFTLGVGFERNGAITECPQFSYPVDF